MKDLHLLIWLTQLGLSIVIPLAGFTFLGVWLHNALDWGIWTIWAGLVLGIICAVNGFRDSIKAMKLMTRDEKQQPPPIAFNQHD